MYSRLQGGGDFHNPQPVVVDYRNRPNSRPKCRWIVLFALIMILHDKFAYIFTSSMDVLQLVDNLSFLLELTILLNSVQPVLSGNFIYIYKESI